MAGVYKGVQSRVMQMNELAMFVPCLAHSLNLVGVHSANRNKDIESAKSLHENFAFLSGHAFLNMSTDDLQKNGADLARKYSKDLNAVDFSQELSVFKDLVTEINEKSSAFDLLQHLCRMTCKKHSFAEKKARRVKL
ncbi:hypothetical protein ACJJTC_018533 [Scirpophaga incertulas]